MKLRFRGNSLRLRVNQREVQALAAGEVLSEEVHFPGQSVLRYTLQAHETEAATFRNGELAVLLRDSKVQAWASGEDVGIYLHLPTDGPDLRLAVEKDLECLDGPPDERDPHAFPRPAGSSC